MKKVLHEEFLGDLMGKITNVGFQKGGVNKTTITILLGLYAVEQGDKVLIIDGDAQVDVSRIMGMPSDYNGPSSDLLFQKAPDEFKQIWSSNSKPLLPVSGWGCRLPSGVDDIGSVMHLVPANAGAMANINDSKNSAFISNFKQNLAFLSQFYDHIFIDTPPQLGLVQYASVCACTGSVMPLIADYDVCGPEKVKKYFQLYNSAKKIHNPKLGIPVVVLSSVDARGKLVNQYVKWARESFGKNMTEKYIEYSQSVNNAKNERRAAWFRPSSGNDRTKGAAIRRVVADIYSRLR
ncbi:chromosome partitioning protein ParA [Alteromonas sp. KUL42]|nr:ParA family protein [Alteromonas sp. KUL42]GEA09109.1 chromosome partitioning protein ParA [Alteromonas sp. KUL42]